LRAKLIDEKMGAGNAIQSISREINQACIWLSFRIGENPAWARHPDSEEPRRWELLPCRALAKLPDASSSSQRRQSPVPAHAWPRWWPAGTCQLSTPELAELQRLCSAELCGEVAAAGFAPL